MLNTVCVCVCGDSCIPRTCLMPQLNYITVGHSSLTTVNVHTVLLYSSATITDPLLSIILKQRNLLGVSGCSL